MTRPPPWMAWLALGAVSEFEKVVIVSKLEGDWDRKRATGTTVEAPA